MNNKLVNIVRDRKGNPRGYVVAVANDIAFNVGWSYVNTKAGDRFNKHLGIQIAENRAVIGTNKKIPHDVLPVLNRMVARGSKYFKQPCNLKVGYVKSSN